MSATASATGGRHSHDETPGIVPAHESIATLLESLHPHDHLCLIYESKEEWRATAMPFIAIGLKRGEKCMYVVDANTTDDIRRYLAEDGTDVASVEQSGQFALLHETEAYTREGSFDPDRMIALLIEETKKAVASGYPALRVTGEMTWVLHGHPGSEQALEYEAKLNRDFFPLYPCLAICQYDRWRFDPEVIKGVIMTHPLLVRGNHIYRNFYYVPPDEYLAATHAATEAQHWLNNLERERQTAETLRASEEKYRALFEQSMDAIALTSLDGRVTEANKAFVDLLGYSREEMGRIAVASLYGDREGRKRFLEWMSSHDALVDDEVRLKKKDGTMMDCVRTVITVRAEDGRVIGFQSVIRDITARKRDERELRESELRFRSLVENTGVAVLLTKTDGTILDCNDAAVQMLGYPREELLKTAMPDLYRRVEERATVLARFERDGFLRAVEVEMKRRDGSPLHVQLTTATAPLRGETVAITEMVNFTERKLAQERLLAGNAQLEQALQGTLHVIEQMTETRDAYTAGHQKRVAELAVAIARQMGLPEDSCVPLINMAALIHDVGKIAVPSEILSKPGRLSPAELELVRTHSQAGYDILKQAGLPYPVPETVLQHHERYDGTGYPAGLSGDDILPEASILAVADVVEAMSSHRPYRAALGMEAALSEVEAGSGTRYYPEVVAACLTVFRDKGFAFSK